MLAGSTHYNYAFRYTMKALVQSTGSPKNWLFSNVPKRSVVTKKSFTHNPATFNYTRLRLTTETTTALPKINEHSWSHQPTAARFLLRASALYDFSPLQPGTRAPSSFSNDNNTIIAGSIIGILLIIDIFFSNGKLVWSKYGCID